MMKAFLFVLFSLALAVANSYEFSAEWVAWKAQHGKKYASEVEELGRYEMFESNLKYVEEHNKNAAKHGYNTTMNEFGDLVSGPTVLDCDVISVTSHLCGVIHWHLIRT